MGWDIMVQHGIPSGTYKIAYFRQLNIVHMAQHSIIFHLNTRFYALSRKIIISVDVAEHYMNPHQHIQLQSTKIQTWDHTFSPATDTKFCLSSSKGGLSKPAMKCSGVHHEEAEQTPF
jgi:hypothetical protein